MILASNGVGFTLEVIWWLAFLCTFGLCLGSFLNVIIYRLPRNMSLGDPKWSFCPGCHSRINWYDNLPVISYLRLRGRCRNCKGSISVRYPLLEMTAGLVVLFLLDAFLIAHTHTGAIVDYPGMTWQLGEDWPILLAHIILMMALLAMSAIDLEHYWVDIRFTTLATVAGFCLHAIWTPNRSSQWPRPSISLAAGSIVAVVTLMLTFLIVRLFLKPAAWVPTAEPEADAPPSPAAPEGEFSGSELPSDPEFTESDGSESASESPKPAGIRHTLGILGLIAVASSILILATGALFEGAGLSKSLSYTARWLPGLIFLFFLILMGGSEPRDADEEIIHSIESERSTARRTVLLELFVILPALALGGVTWYYGESCTQTRMMFEDILQWAPTTDWTPLRGIATAAAGFLLGGAVGWFVRIVATLILGREAFGSGDIHMMAAAGCVCGWQTVLVGFILCSILAVIGWLLMLPIKRTRAIPLGPWLSIAFLIVVLFYDPIMASKPIRNMAYLFNSMPVLFEKVTTP
ncbi:MAG TPA: A24 family peptidase [Phycisphaerae bacterium]|nr:A24 family peptidase [Phycisphaerae bacterium]